jgi:hypothetical protein
MAAFQLVGMAKPNRGRWHVWQLRGTDYKCVTCGAITKSPPKRDEEEDWLPERFEPLTEEEKKLCPPS